jgi:hypothetical protein
MVLVAAGMLLSSAALADKPEKHQKEREHGRERGNPHRGDYYRNEGDDRGRVVEDRHDEPRKGRGWKKHERYAYDHDRDGRDARVVEVYQEHPRGRHYHPKWHPRHDFARRWVYFPRYNMYWDNSRSVYVYSSCGRWVANPEPPRVALNVNLSAERFVELGVDLDVRNDVFELNSQHRVVFKL